MKQADLKAAERALTMCRLIDKNIEDVRGMAFRLRPGVQDELGLVDAIETILIKVLLADYHSIVRAGIRRIVEESGHMQVVAEADDGREAISMVKKLGLRNNAELSRFAMQNQPIEP